MTYELDESLALTDEGEGRWRGRTSPGYGNAVGPFGGWIAALLMRAILNQGPQGEPLSLTVTFLGGCKDGELTGSTRLLRRSRTNEHWTAEFSDSENLVAHAVASFGLRRPTVALGDLPPPEPAPPADTVPARPAFGDRGPAFFGRYDYRQFEGKPFRVNPTTRSRAWVKDMDGRPLDHVSLAAHADSPMPRVFLVSDRPSAIATMSMSVYFHATPAAFAETGGGFLLIDCEARRGFEGFYDQTARLWTPSGQLLATTEQVVWYNLKPAA